VSTMVCRLEASLLAAMVSMLYRGELGFHTGLRVDGAASS
jgi:hypothetical protein